MAPELESMASHYWQCLLGASGQLGMNTAIINKMGVQPHEPGGLHQQPHPSDRSSGSRNTRDVLSEQKSVLFPLDLEPLTFKLGPRFRVWSKLILLMKPACYQLSSKNHLFFPRRRGQPRAQNRAVGPIMLKNPDWQWRRTRVQLSKSLPSWITAWLQG